MKRHRRLIAIFAVMAAIVALVMNYPTSAQIGAAGNAPARYQISAYGAKADSGFVHGCYIIDTETGQLWHARSGGFLPEKITSKLP